MIKKRHLCINGHFRKQPVTGVQRYAWEIIRRFDDQGTDYRWVQPSDRLQPDALRQLWIQAVMPFKIPDDTVLWSPTNIGPVWCENQVLTLHDIADQLHPEWFDAKYVAWRRFILPRLLRRVRRVITVSKFSRDTIVRRFPQAQNKIEVVYNGVRHDRFYPHGGEEIDKMRAHFNLTKPFVLSVGSLDGRKNVHGLIKAWHRLSKNSRKGMELVIAGGSSRKFNNQKHQYTGWDIRFMGYVPDEWLPVLYSGAQIFAYPSMFEGFGLPVLEAMACGTPVVTSNTTSLKELAGGNTLTVDPNEPEAIAEALNKFLNSGCLRKKYEQRGLKYVSEFSWEKTAENTIEVLNNCR